jgi:RNA polymerase sigma-70 factor (ECF subfamily)
MAGQNASDQIRGSSASEPCDYSLIGRSRAGDQDAATELYLRYARRLNSLVESQCSTDLARRAGVDDIVQSVFGSFFRLMRQGSYDAPDGDELWKLLLVIAIHKVRDKAVYHHAAKRNRHRTLDGDEALRHMKLSSNDKDSPDGYLDLVLDEIMEQLSCESRNMAKLRLEGYKVAEIARKTGRSRRTVERILQETRAKLDQLVREEE